MAFEIRFAFSRGLFMDRLHAVGKFSLLEKQLYEHLETIQQLTSLNKMNKAYVLYIFLKRMLADETVFSVSWKRGY